MKKYILSILLCLCMTGIVLPITLQAEIATPYGIWVGGVQVTSANADNITGSNITGSVSYDATTNTLTLNNASINTAKVSDSFYNDAYGILSGSIREPRFTIKLEGNNTINGIEYSLVPNSYGICVSGTVAFEGNGSLYVSSADCTGQNTWSVAIYITDGAIVKKGCTIEAVCGAATNKAAIYNTGNTVLNGTKISAAKDSDGVLVANPENVYDKMLTYSYIKLVPDIAESISTAPGIVFFNCKSGYTNPTPERVTVTNTGNVETGELTVRLAGDDADKFELSVSTISSIPVGGSAEFTIVPKEGCSVGHYPYAEVRIYNSGQNIDNYVGIRLTVNPKSPIVSGTIADASYTVGEAASPLTVSATTDDEGSLKYQWLRYLGIRNGIDLFESIIGETNQTFIPPTDTAGTVTYYCEVSNVLNGRTTNAYSEKATITVTGSGNHSHHGGTATCWEAAVCTVCNMLYGSVDSNNHTGEIEIRNYMAPTATEEGYTGDTYCLACGEKIATGMVIPATGVVTDDGNEDNSNDSNNDDGKDAPPVNDEENIPPAYMIYTIQRGDTLWAIARKYNCTVFEIIAANSELIKKPNMIITGWQIKIPQAGIVSEDTEKSDTVLPDEKETAFYIVKRGDSLWSISKKYGCSVAELIALNRDLITNPNMIRVGWRLKIMYD